MNKKGFTMVELLGVIILLAIIMTIAVPAITGITENIKENMLDKKANIIEEAAILMGQDVRNSISSSTLKYKNFPCKSIIVSDLVPRYLDKDNDNECLTNSSIDGNGCIVDPSNPENYLDKYEVIIYYKSKRIHAVVDIDNKLTCS